MGKRKSGILVHPTSFPSPYGIGDLGQAAYDFIDFLVKSGGSYWQILPLGFTSFGDSPYQSFSTFAGNPYLISPDELLKDGLLTAADLTPPEFAANETKIDYGSVIEYKNALLKKAFKKFTAKKSLKKEFDIFCEKNSAWLKDFALFLALKNYFIKERKTAGATREYTKYKNANKKLLTPSQTDDYYYGAVWNSWPEPLARRDPTALEIWAGRLKKDLDFYSFSQFMFFKQWARLKTYANEAGVKIIGDIPIFVAMDSADTWSNPKLFNLKPNGDPAFVAGVPPDYFCETGQLWGNPLYDWAYHKKTDYKWWGDRIKSTLNLVDVLRIDHFRGFESYWKVLYGKPNAVEGVWAKGPGKALFDALFAELGELPIIAEDLGIITDEVRHLRADCGFPGMKVLQFGFGDNPYNEHLPHNLTDIATVIYTGTHDNDTSVGWYAQADEAARDHHRRYMNVSGNDPAWELIRLAYSSVAEIAIVPIWDAMRLDGSNRMNTPGVAAGNWQFRYTKDMLQSDLAGGLNYLAEMYARKRD